MELTPGLKNMGFSLVETDEADVNAYIQVNRAVYKKYIDLYRDFFGEWNDELVYETFCHKRTLTFFRKLLLHNEVVGFMNYDLKEDKIDEVSIHIIAKAQNKGIGTLFFRSLQEFRKPIFIAAVKANPAINLYARLGFEPYREDEIFCFMTYNP